MRGLPVQAVLLTGFADEFLCILFDAAALLREVLGLGIRQGRAYVDGGDLVAPYAARQDLFFSGWDVEIPLARCTLHEWDRECFVVGANQQQLAAVA